MGIAADVRTVGEGMAQAIETLRIVAQIVGAQIGALPESEVRDGVRAAIETARATVARADSEQWAERARCADELAGKAMMAGDCLDELRARDIHFAIPAGRQATVLRELARYVKGRELPRVPEVG